MKKKLKLGFEQLGKEMLVLSPNALSHYFGGTSGPGYDCVPTAIDHYLATFGAGTWTGGDASIASYDAIHGTDNGSASGGVDPAHLNGVMDHAAGLNGFVAQSYTATAIAGQFDGQLTEFNFAAIGYYNNSGGGSHAVNVTQFKKEDGDWYVYYDDHQNESYGQKKKASDMVGVHVFDIPGS